MGDFNVRQIKNKEDRYNMYHHALQDIRSFEQMLEKGVFSDGPIKIGSEQELCLVNENYEPSKSALDLLDKINDPHYTNELGLFNMEINCDPENMEGKCFSVMENKLLDLLNKGKKEASAINEKIIMAGILPTISEKHLDFDYMTPIPRYQTISKMLHDIRGGSFEIYLQGVDDLMASLGSVLFEACNTSFQMHLQIKPSEFVDKFNWSQMISGPVMAACVNSPLLFGRELWAESRIAVFKQSLDTRNSKNHLRKKLPRVYFGDRWLEGSPVNLWKNELTRFPLLLTSDDFKNSEEQVRNNITPKLRAIRLHTGTTYTWNRLCYGPGKVPHIRIECRYLAAGPTVIDEMSNFAFWAGLMEAMPQNWNEEHKNINFKSVKDNFVKSARNGLNTVMSWYNKDIPTSELILNTLLPLARKGLESHNIDTTDIDKYLGVIEARVKSRQTGSNWIVENYRSYAKQQNNKSALQYLVAKMSEYQDQNIPIHQWKQFVEKDDNNAFDNANLNLRVEHLMSQDVFTVNKDVSIEFVDFIMNSKNIHHLPIENFKGELVGIITDGIIKKVRNTNQSKGYASDIMITEPVSVEADMEIKDLVALLKDKELFGVPVLFKNRIVGMITKNDLKDGPHNI